MAGNTLTQATINQALFQQATDIGNFYIMAKQKLVEWQVNLPNTDAMTAVGFEDAGDQAVLTQWIADLEAMVAHFEGTEQSANSRSLIADLAALKKVS